MATAPAVPARPLMKNRQPPPAVPSRWGSCAIHTGSTNMAICKTCAVLLCSECLSDVRLDHPDCSVQTLNSDLHCLLHELTSRLMLQMDETIDAMTRLQRSLASKRQRMDAKRSETTTEVERYFTKLKEKMEQKLKREERDLLELLNAKVAEQDSVISQNIETCEKALRTLEEKKTELVSMGGMNDHARESPSNISITSIKTALATSDAVKSCLKSKTGLEDARNSFMVIRFIVDSDAETFMLSKKVSAVEVLNSKSEHQDQGNLEVERINEAARTVANEHRQRRSLEGELMHSARELRVVLPAVTNRSYSAEVLLPLNPSSSNETMNQTARVASGETSARLSVSSSPSNSERSLLSTSNNQNSDSDVARQSSSQNIRMNANYDVALDVSSASSGHSEIQDSSPIALAYTTLTPSLSHPDIRDGSLPSDVDSVENAEHISQISNESADNQSGITGHEEDDPPPPYPGLPRASPRPNEQPPPYPGPPPPPYSQTAEPHSSHVSRSTSAANICDLQQDSPRPRGNKITKVFSVTEVYDKRCAGIFALAVVRTNCFVVVDRWNRKLKYFNSAGDSYGGLIFREEPWDVTLITTDLVAVTVPKLNTLYKIQVTDQSVVTTSTVRTLRRYACVAYHGSNEMFICGQVPQFGEPVIDVIGLYGGPILQSFRQDSVTRRDSLTFSYPRYVKVTDDGIVIVCDWNLKCLMLFKMDGSFVGRYRGTVEFPLNEPTGMTYDAEKREIYVIDSKHTSSAAAIHAVSLTCECKDIIKWDNELRVAPAISACEPGFALGSKSGAISLFRPVCQIAFRTESEL